jgi:hypothetical protein
MLHAVIEILQKELVVSTGLDNLKMFNHFLINMNEV